MADARDLKSLAERRVGSTPTSPTNAKPHCISSGVSDSRRALCPYPHFIGGTGDNWVVNLPPVPSLAHWRDLLTCASQAGSGRPSSHNIRPHRPAPETEDVCYEGGCTWHRLNCRISASCPLLKLTSVSSLRSLKKGAVPTDSVLTSRDHISSPLAENLTG